jgi:glycosyltransferase involved in cell wall biosynthesis
MGVPSKRALVKLWATQRPDVVHIATEGPLGWSALQAALHLRLPVCSDFRTNFHAYSRHYGIGWLHRPIMAYLRKFHNSTQCTMVPTPALQRDLLSAGFRQVMVVSRGVDTERFDPRRRSASLRAQWGASEGDVVLACVGRLAPEKNLGALMAAYEAVRERVPRTKLLLVGDGPLREALRARCPDALMAGQRTGEDLAAHYASADLFVFPSMTETFGNVTLEALASGLPVVAFDDAAAAQLVRSGESGRLVAVGDEAAFVQATVALAGDATARARMSARARQSASTLGWDGVVARFETVLSSVARRVAPSTEASVLPLPRRAT